MTLIHDTIPFIYSGTRASKSGRKAHFPLRWFWRHGSDAFSTAWVMRWMGAGRLKGWKVQNSTAIVCV